MASPRSTTQVPTDGSRLGGDLRLDGGRFRHELQLRGITAGAVARVAKVSPNTLTRCLHGAPITIGTLNKIVRALQSLPMLPGADELLRQENNREGQNLAVVEGGHGAGLTQTD